MTPGARQRLPDREPFYYLCTPFAAHPLGIHHGFMDAASLLGELLKRGYHVFSPIAHCYPASIQASLPETHDFWIPLDKKYIDRCDALLVALMPNWSRSKGIGMEIEHAEAAGKPVYYLDLRNFMAFTNREDALKAFPPRKADARTAIDAGKFNQPV